ncbi:S15/NS1 RNA-binding domain-containing protein [Athelia psychrophila]|uniref:S15/NS1 RNA-binding domain-containing protein n=1 Tax=Athelia psychrophila TaxID=1759441 RepID=A0A166EE57_9AGAM|nr:S15/NS1 RNA-binding domain-containing protein [Fibularhizoctonia sp. CBS 109695]KZP15669.1 S15/NS1 RNA-binding domain-containing protein [Fibularhizoctonia sp. CBS 109695]
MLRNCLAQGSSAVASSSPRCLASLHTSAVVGAAHHPLNMSTKRKIRADRLRREEENRPHPVLGNRRGDDAKWPACDLAKILVTEQELSGLEPEQKELSYGVLTMPKLLNYGVGPAEKQLLFEQLPPLTAQRDGLRQPEKWTATSHADAERVELMKVNMLARVIDLRNANAGGIAYENRRRIIAAFSEPGKPEDTGSPEVQVALVTFKIRNLWDHLQRQRSDRGNRPRLTKLVHGRAKMLKYLKSVSRQRYDDLLPRLGLEPGSVEGELII